MLKEGVHGFKGGMTAKKYVRITQTSKATATRDMQHLKELGIFIPFGGGGRNTAYQIKI
jgi:Fic family protein